MGANTRLGAYSNKYGIYIALILLSSKRLTTKHLSLVKRVEISLREFIIRRHASISPSKENRKKQFKEPYEGKGLSADEVY